MAKRQSWEFLFIIFSCFSLASSDNISIKIYATNTSSPAQHAFPTSFPKLLNVIKRRVCECLVDGMVWIGILIKIWTDPWILWSGCMIEYHFIYLFIDAGRMSFCLSLWWIYFHVSRSNGVCRSMDVCFSKTIYERFSGINLSNIVRFSSRHHCADDGGGYHWLFGLRGDQFICLKAQPNIFFQ